LLSFRGWALHDQKATAFSLQPLPPLHGLMAIAQARRTRPVDEIDNRPGWYAKLGWSPAEAFEVQFLHYDNRGDPHAKSIGLQWGWRTRFDNIGAIVSLGRVQLKAQAMGGRTEMGFPMAGRIWVDTRFRSAFLLGTRSFDRGSVSARVEAFGTKGRGSVLDEDYSDKGWAVTLAARRDLGEHFSLLAEYLHVSSRIEERDEIGLAPRQRTNQLQLALRVHF
jgi:hypothetical protein